MRSARLTLLILAAACSDPTDPSGYAGPVLVAPEAVTPAVAPSVQGGGFVLPIPPWTVTSPARRDSLLAVLPTVLRHFRASSVAQRWTEEHGRPITWDDLQACGRTYYARTPFAPLPDAIPAFYRQQAGGVWVGSLCGSRGDRQLTVTLTDAESAFIIENGDFRKPWANGGELHVAGTRPNVDRGLPLSPEQAAMFVYQQLNVRVAAVPEAWRWYPFPWLSSNPGECPLWRVALESAREFRDEFLALRSADAVYVGRYPDCHTGRPAFWLPRPQAPAVVIDTGGLVPVPLVAPYQFARATIPTRRPRGS